MKKLMIFSTLGLMIAFTACAQKLDASKVPAAVKTAFAQKFPGASAAWGKESSKEYEAEFTMNGKDVSANFLTDGNWVETEMEIGANELPTAASNAVMAKYPGAVIDKVFKIENAKGVTTYEAEIKTGSKKRELVLDAAGKIIK